jgi:hypothetical protein
MLQSSLKQAGRQAIKEHACDARALNSQINRKTCNDDALNTCLVTGACLRAPGGYPGLKRAQVISSGYQDMMCYRCCVIDLHLCLRLRLA